MDLVGHKEGVAGRDFAFTLNLNNVHTGWTEPRAIFNKAQKCAMRAKSKRHC